jgi:hypothetical protein
VQKTIIHNPYPITYNPIYPIPHALHLTFHGLLFTPNGLRTGELEQGGVRGKKFPPLLKGRVRGVEKNKKTEPPQSPFIKGG